MPGRLPPTRWMLTPLAPRICAMPGIIPRATSMPTATSGKTDLATRKETGIFPVSFHPLPPADEARRGVGRTRLVMRPGRPLAQRQRAHRRELGDLDLLLGDFEVAGRLAVLDPVDQHTQHVDIGGRAG